MSYHLTRSPYYPDDLPLSAYCEIEGCVGRGPCPRCGETNYHLMGYYGAVAKWAKEWGISEDEAEKRTEEHEHARAVKAGEICGTCSFPPDDEFCHCEEQGSHRWER